MKEVFIETYTLPRAYHKALLHLYIDGEIADCADWNQKQKEISVTIVIMNPLEEPMISKLFIGGPEELEQYRQEMLEGILDFEVEKGNWAYTYHDRMVNYPKYNHFNFHSTGGKLCKSYTRHSLNQIDFVINELKRNPSSRRAVILIRDNLEDAYSDDPACLQHIQYFIREDKLHCKVLFRSNDACKASFMNMFALIMLQKRIADELRIEVGTYTHRANSFHCYEKDFPMLEKYFNAYLYDCESQEKTTYNYVGDWEEIMEECKPMIAKKVEELKNR